jgi:hypothetical protein
VLSRRAAVVLVVLGSVGGCGAFGASGSSPTPTVADDAGADADVTVPEPLVEGGFSEAAAEAGDGAPGAVPAVCSFVDNGATPTPLACNTITCTGSQVCCLNPTNPDCSVTCSFAAWTCSRPGDCADARCCIFLSPFVPPPSGTACPLVAGGMGSGCPDTCGAGGHQACDAAHPCPGDRACNAVSVSLGSSSAVLGVCLDAKGN